MPGFDAPTARRRSPCDGGGDATGSAAGPDRCWSWVAIAFLWFVLAVLQLVVDPGGFDISLLPRLLVLLAFLAPCVALAALRVGATPADGGSPFDTAPLTSPAARWLAAFTVVTWLSLGWAFNPSAGLADAFKVTAMLAAFALTCLLLPALPRWRDHLPIIVSCGVLALVGIGVADISRARAALPAGTLLPDRRLLEAHLNGGQSSVNLYANLLVMLLPWCLFGAMTSRGWRRILGGTAAAATLAMVVLAQSRAAWLGLAAGLTAAFAATLAGRGRLGLSRTQVRGLVAAAAAAVGGVGAFVALAPDEIGIARRLRSIVVDPPAVPGTPFRDGGRREIWRVTGRMIADRPLLGVGAGNFGIAVQSYYDERIDLSRMHHNWSTPHNDFLWIFAEKGVVGFVAFVGFLLASAGSAWRLLGRAGDRRDSWIAVSLLALLAAYATISGIDFPLERVSQPMVLGVSCGVLAVLAAAARGADAAAPAVPPWSTSAGRWLAPAGAVVAAVLAVGVVWTAAAVIQDRRLVAAYQALRTQQWEAMLERAREADTPWRTIDSNLTPIAYLEGFALLQLGRLDEATASMERSLDDNPNRLSTLSNLGILHAQAGRFGEAEICLREVVRRYPQHPPGYVNLANCLIDAGRPAEAQALLEAIPEEMRTEAIRQALDIARAAADAEPGPGS